MAEKITECRVRRTVSCEDSAKVQVGRRPVQKWEGDGREDYRVQSTEYGF